ncbi:unnamed protein product [Soboliphyme baturini]|uniref:Acetylcholine receptor subunit alpha-type unc-38 n=1 Tax=Soboliphyme baturini TaxID=241478 RepID=A0A183IWM6_9BILA|nr:unnamed protein product [Soboliphyme baturini]
MYDYNKISRPVKNFSEVLLIKFGASLIRIIDIDEKNQVFTTNLWLDMEWIDSKLHWDPEVYGGLKKLHIPADLLWTPDILLYNNAAGDPEITIFNDAVVYYDGRVVWKPPAIYKSFCLIDVTWFPYDSQACVMKFGMWSYGGMFVDMRQLPENMIKEVVKDDNVVEFLETGMDLSYFYRSAEWDLLRLTSERHAQIYTSCCGPSKYVDITYYFSLRRKTLFYTVNLIIPCFLISFLTTLVFYNSDHKITFSIGILVTLTVFFLVLIEIIPPTSLVIPMFGKYLLLTIILVTLSISISVVTVNIHFRRGSTNKIPKWVRRVFIEFLPRWLWIDYPEGMLPTSCAGSQSPDIQNLDDELLEQSGNESPFFPRKNESAMERQLRLKRQLIIRLLRHVHFIARHFREMEQDDKEASEWVFIAMVIDRLFLVIFSLCNIGTLFVILQAPTLYDKRGPLAIPEATRPLGQDTLGPAYE